MSLIVKIILLSLLLSLPWPVAEKTQYFVHLTFYSTLQLIYDIQSDFWQFIKHFHGTANVAFFKIPFTPSAAVFPNNLPLYLKDLTFSVFSLLLLKLVASCF